MGVRKARNRALVAANPVGLPKSAPESVLRRVPDDASALDTSKLGPVQEPSIPVQVLTPADLEREKIKAIFASVDPAAVDAQRAKARAEADQWHRDRANFAKAMEAEQERLRREREAASSGQIITSKIGG